MILARLGVETQERRSVALMLAHSFFMGCATVYFETAASATFLARFAASMIPWVYLAAAVLNLGTGAVYTQVQRRVSFARLMKGTLWFLAVLGLAVRLGLAASSLPWVAFSGLVVYRIVSSLTDLEYWAVASRIYDVGQAKRLFGLIGTGEVVARMAGAFSVPLLVHHTRVANLMLLSGVALVACVVLLSPILRGAEAAAEGPASVEPARSVRSGLREIASSRYLVLVVSVAVLATFGKYFVDFAFLERIGSARRTEAEIASVLAVFNGVTQTSSLLIRLFVSRPLLERFGVRVGVMVLPVLHAVCAAVTVVAGFVGAPTVVFWSVLANQGVYKTFKHPIDNASFKVLYQPLRRGQRLSAQIAVEVLFSPVVVGLAGVVMLIFSRGLPPERFALLLVVLFVGWALAAGAAGRGYARRLVEALRPGAERPSTRSLEANGHGLVQELFDADAAARSRILVALEETNQQERPTRKLVELLRQEAEAAAWTRAAARELESVPGLHALHACLLVDAGAARARVAHLLALCTDRDGVSRALGQLGDASREQRAYAKELLTMLAPARARAAVWAALGHDEPIVPQRLGAAARLAAIAARDDRWGSPAARRLAASLLRERAG